MKNKTMIVTGGSRGIGKDIVLAFANEGYNIVLNYNNSEMQALKIKGDLKEKGINIEIFKADVSKENDVKELINFTIKKFNKIDILINNAGISELKMFQDITLDEWNKMINTNLTSCFLTIKEVIPYMISKKEGCIINISSIWGQTGAALEAHYSASKAGVDGLTKSLAKELGPSNIRVNSISPGIIDTDMNKNIKDDDLENIKNEIPLCKIGKTSDISNCIKWLINDKYTTGQIINVNGGWYI